MHSKSMAFLHSLYRTTYPKGGGLIIKRNKLSQHWYSGYVFSHSALTTVHGPFLDLDLLCSPLTDSTTGKVPIGL